MIAVVEQAHQRRYAERARDQNDFVMRFGRELARGGDGRTCLLKFAFGQLRLADEFVQMPHSRAHDFPEARIAGSIELAQYRLGHVALILDDHRFIRTVAAQRDYLTTVTRSHLSKVERTAAGG